MGTELIKDPRLRKNWENFINRAHKELKENKINLLFTTFKDDGSYSKAKSGITAVYFVFAQDSSRTWVELELKPRTILGVRRSQSDLYECLKQKYKQTSVKSTYRIIWNEEDINTSPRNPEGMDIRIKYYIINKDESEWIKAMCNLITVFLPLLKNGGGSI